MTRVRFDQGTIWPGFVLTRVCFARVRFARVRFGQGLFCMCSVTTPLATGRLTMSGRRWSVSLVWYCTLMYRMVCGLTPLPGSTEALAEPGSGVN